jgi:hypothetical protein
VTIAPNNLAQKGALRLKNDFNAYMRAKRSEKQGKRGDLSFLQFTIGGVELAV